MPERKIGERFRVGYDTLECVEAPPHKEACLSCCLLMSWGCGKHDLYDHFGPCCAMLRTDNKQVFFKIIE